MRALGPMRNAARLDDVAEEIEVDEIEMHARAFAIGEGTIQERRIAQGRSVAQSF
jgi:hypothetical protein